MLKTSHGKPIVTSIGKLTLEWLAQQYSTELFAHFIPNMKKFVVDYHYGGFMCEFDISSAVQISENKRAWYEGRGIWLYAFLYNNFELKDEYLTIATQSKNFILQHTPGPGKFFSGSFKKNGDVLSASGDIFGNLYIAEGLIEYGWAAGSREYIKMGKALLIDSVGMYEHPDYQYAPFNDVSGAKFLNHWMVILWIASQSLAREPDAEIDRITNRCLEMVMDYHLNADSRLLNEILLNDLRPSHGEYGRICNFGVSIQTLWMVMYEAKRRKDSTLFTEATKLFKRHVMVAKDEVYGGYFGYLDDVKNQRWRVSKILGLHEEILIGSLFLIEHTDDEWAKQCFEETFTYVQNNFRKDNYVFWTSSGDRKMVVHNTTRVEFYHHSRFLMLSLLSLRRMLSKQG